MTLMPIDANSNITPVPALVPTYVKSWGPDDRLAEPFILSCSRLRKPPLGRELRH
jgi:hypothetical protein